MIYLVLLIKLRKLRHAKIIKCICSEYFFCFPCAPSFLQDCFALIFSSIMRIQNQIHDFILQPRLKKLKKAYPILLIHINSKKSIRKNTSSDHNRCSMIQKMLFKIMSFRQDFGTTANINNLTLNLKNPPIKPSLFPPILTLTKYCRQSITS
jgi:hypothetical protein